MTWPDHLSEYWYALALERELGERPLARTLLDKPVVIARLGRDVVAFEDRCPHRQMPLSAGCIVGEQLQCAYHGWRFDRAGSLCAVPGAAAQTTLPRVGLKSLVTRVQDGLIWVSYAATDATDLPSIAKRHVSADRRFLWSTTWKAHLLDALENVLDATHMHFVHSGLVRRSGARNRFNIAIRSEENGFVVDYQGHPVQSGLIYQLFESRRTGELARFQPGASVQFEYRYQGGAVVTMDLHFAPESSQITRLHVASHIHGRFAPSWAVRLLVWPFLRRVAMQDCAMLALQAENRRKFGGLRDAIGPTDVVKPWLDAWFQNNDRSITARERKLFL